MFYLLICNAFFFFFFKQKTAYEMRISDWRSDVCSSDLGTRSRSWAASSANRPPTAASTSSARKNAWPPVGRAGDQDRQRLHDGGGAAHHRDRKSVVSGKRVSLRVDLGGRRIIKKYTISK